MKDFLKDTIKDSLKQLIITALSPAAVAIGSKIATGSWLEWFEFLPLWFWFLILALVFCLPIVYKRHKVIKSYDTSQAWSTSVPPYEWEELTRIPYDDVVWVVQRDGRGPDARRMFPRNDPRPSEIRIATPARCAKCETELKEKRRFLGGFLRYCIKCSFKKRCRESFYDTSKSVELLARREIGKTTGFSSGY
jgi:hypothetical protein